MNKLIGARLKYGARCHGRISAEECKRWHLAQPDKPIDSASDPAWTYSAMSLIREQGLDLEALGLNREELQRRLRQTRNRRYPDAPKQLPCNP